LALEPQPVFAHLHEPAAGPAGTGVLLCPAFGWDELCSHRSLARFAAELAAAGHAALRIDLPGTGDSGGSPRDPGLLGAWLAATSGAAAWLRDHQDCRRVVAFGVGLGGLLAGQALADGAPIDDLILWSVPARGRALIRELRAFAALTQKAAAADDVEIDAAPAGGLEIGGFLIADETRAALEQLDLSATAIPDAARRRALLMGRDGMTPDERLRAHLAGAGVEVTVADGTGYSAMMTHPQFARTPEAAFARAISWLSAGASPGGHDSTPPGPRDRTAEPRDPSARPAIERTAEAIELTAGSTRIRERPFVVAHGSTRLRGVLSEPAGETNPPAEACVVLLNAGSIRRVGPNRMWVEMARGWAARGIPTLRLDLEGIGDSDGDESLLFETPGFYRPELEAEVRSVLNALIAQGSPSRFVIGGLCSGAYWAFHAALADERVCGLLLINLWFFFWSEEIASQRDAQQARIMLREGRWREVAEIALSDGRISRMARTRVRSWLQRGSHEEVDRPDQIDASLDLIRDRRVRTLLLLSDGEAMTDFLRETGRIDRLERWPNIELARIPIADHIFRPHWAQRLVSDALDRGLEAILAADRDKAFPVP
jgi:alpha-beta hydrolase superfamily lysophospholipase